MTEYFIALKILICTYQ